MASSERFSQSERLTRRFCLVELDGIDRAVRIRSYVTLEGLGKGRNAAGLGPLPGRVFAPGDPSEQILGHTPRLVGGDMAVASDDHPLIGRLASTRARAVVDDERLRARGLDANAESRQLLIPGDPGFFGWLERLDGAPG